MLCTTKLQPASYTHTRTYTHSLNTFCQSATTELATVCVLPPSLLQASRSALRQAGEADTHSHTHTLFSAPLPYFLEGERRGASKSKTAQHFSYFQTEGCCKNPPDVSGISLLLLKVVPKRFGSIVVAKGICTTQPASQLTDTQKVGRQKKGIWTYVVDFGSERTCNVPVVSFFFWMGEGRSNAKGFSLFFLKNTLSADDPLGSGYAQSPPVCYC